MDASYPGDANNAHQESRTYNIVITLFGQGFICIKQGERWFTFLLHILYSKVKERTIVYKCRHLENICN
jgi:hypothetical protein